MTRMLVVCASVGMLLVPTAFAADPTPADFKNAAKYCKAVRESKGVEAFQSLYGTNPNKKNAFGKCVSKTANAKAEKREDARGASPPPTAACKKEKADNAAKFAQDYKNFGQCVKAKKNQS